MGMPEAKPRLLRFRGFELDQCSGELRKHGSKISLQEQPFQVLSLLVKHAGEVVTREELRGQLWNADTFVDFEDGLNTTIRKIRAALGDSVESPQFIETLPRRGYRFIVPVEGVGPTGDFREKPSSGASRAPIVSVAVLPLQNLSGDPAQQYFADGMTEALTTNLAQIRALRVISRASASHYQHTQKLMPEIARELGVEGVVDGSVLRSQGFVRVTAELVHGPTDEHLWAQTYQRELRDVLAIQSELALAIATEVQIRLTHAEKARLSTPREVKPEALEAYLRGRYFWNRRTEEALNKGMDYFKQSILEDPTYAPAYVGLADCYTMLAWNSMLPPKDALPMAKTSAMIALKLDDELADAHSSLAFSLLFHDWDWAGAERQFQRAIELNPSYVLGRPWYAFELSALGRDVEACTECQRALRIDPISFPIIVSSGLVFYLARQYDRDLEICQRILEMDPTGFYQGYFVVGEVYERKGMYAEAIQALETAVRLSHRNPHMLAVMGYALARSGKTAEAIQLIDELKGRPTRVYTSPFNIAMIYAGLGQKDETLEWLEKAYEDRSMWLIFVNAYPIFDFLRPDPRFHDLVRRMGFSSA